MGHRLADTPVPVFSARHSAAGTPEVEGSTTLPNTSLTMGVGHGKRAAVATQIQRSSGWLVESLLKLSMSTTLREQLDPPHCLKQSDKSSASWI